ncbi:MAG: hypothetical protein P4L50_14050 [Anaerolineaceae bacterium]|nr:hypothetical protein [Anaerolineaceae bacterium]
MSSIFKNQMDDLARREVLIALILLVAFTSLAWISPVVQHKFEPTRTARAHTALIHAAIATAPVRAAKSTPAFYLNTGTPLPPDWVNNADQTNSIIVGAIILVLIVLVGALTSLRARK